MKRIEKSDAFDDALHQVIHDIIYNPFPVPIEKCPGCGEILWMKTPDMKKWWIYLLYCENCEYEREERTPGDVKQKIIDSNPGTRNFLET